MSYSLTDINYRTVVDPAAFLAECDAEYEKKVRTAARNFVRFLRCSLQGPFGGLAMSALFVVPRRPSCCIRRPCCTTTWPTTPRPAGARRP